MKKLVLLVEGQGDQTALPVLVKRLLSEYEAWDSIQLDPNPIRCGGIDRLAANNFAEWRRFLEMAGKSRGNPAGILIVLDGDSDKFLGQIFCPSRAALELSKQALVLGAGQQFSTAVVIAVKEFESWLIAGIKPLAGRKLRGELVIPVDLIAQPTDLEHAPRDAKKWLRQAMHAYRETIHQAVLAEAVDISEIRSRNLRSFARLESALHQLIQAFRTDAPIATP